MFDLSFWVLGSLLKGTALLLVVFGVATALRTTSAAFRHLLWSGGILAVLLLPLVSLAVPWRLPLITVPAAAEPFNHPSSGREGGLASATTGGQSAGSRPDAHTAVAEPSTSPAGSISGAGSGGTRPAAPSLPPARVLAAGAIGLWLAGVLFVLGRLTIGAALVRRIVRRAAPLDSPDWTRPLLEAADRMALNRAPRLLISDRLPIPFACGVLDPAIVVPHGAREWSDRRRRAVLCHELAHIRRLDLPVNALAQLACALYWFHPLVWVAARRLRLEGERACDDLVLGVGTRPSEYADHLLQIVCRAARVRAPAMALPMAERREFEGRMLAILERGVRRDSPTPRHAATLAAFAVACLLPLAALAPTRDGPVALSTTPQQGDLGAEQTAGPVGSQVPRRQVVEAPSAISEPASPGTLRSASRQAVEPDGKPDPDPAWSAPGSYGQDQNQGHQDKNQDHRTTGQSQSDTSKAKVIAALAGALNDSVASVREDAAYALGQLEAPAAVAPLAASLTRDTSPKVRTMAAWALGQIESKDAVTALGTAAGRDQSEDVRRMAIWALGQIEDPSAVPALVAALSDASAEIRGRAAWALGTIEPENAPTGLLAALRDPTASVRLRAAWALGQIEDPAAVSALTVAMRDSSSEVRRAAFWAVGQIGGEAAEPALIEALKDPDPEVRAQAARALAGRGGSPWPWPWPMPIIR